MAWRKKHKIQESKRDEIARMKQWIEALKETKGQIDVISIKTASLNEKLSAELSKCTHMHGLDYTNFADEQKQALGALVNNTKALSSLLNETIEA